MASANISFDKIPASTRKPGVYAEWNLKRAMRNLPPKLPPPGKSTATAAWRLVGQSYRELIPQHIGNPRTLLVLDPPYVCTQQGNYRKAAYFGMVEFLRLMAMVRPPFVFFSSTRSELPAYLDLVAELRLPGWERFAGSQTLTVSSTINRNSSYDDHLIYKF